MTARLLRVLLAVSIIAVGLAPLGSHAQESQQESWAAVVRSQGGNIRTGWNERVEITIDRWSTPDETSGFLNLFKENGSQALVDAFQEGEPVGHIRVGQRMSYPLSFARQIGKGGGKRQIRVATDRRISSWEAINQERTMETWQFAFMQLDLDENNEGEGFAIIGAKLTIDDEGHFHIEAYDGGLHVGSVRPR